MKAIIQQNISIGVSVLLALVVIGYGEFRHYQLAQAIDKQMASTTAEINANIMTLQEGLSQLTSQNNNLKDTVASEQSQSSLVQSQVGNIVSTVGTLDKLQKTDPQLLAKYSKVYFLNEHYTPSALTNIDSTYLADKNKPLQIHAQVAPFLEKLLQAAGSAGVNLQVISAYRSFGTQAALKSSYKVTYGAGTANQFSADQGYSEHQLGTALDFTTPTVGATFTGFENSPAYTWLVNNAYQYGFVLSYPPNNKYYEYEPWHWRFIGVDLATKLHRDNQYFYDVDQRVINDYLAAIFD